MAGRPVWVFCSGLKRSGSTLQYQLAKTIVEASGRGRGLGYCEPAQWPELHREYGDADGILVVKSHRYLPGAGRLLRSGQAKSIFVYRDLRDAYVSWMGKAGRTFDAAMEEGFLEEVLEDDFHWSTQPNTLRSSYESMIEDVPGEVERIAGFLGVDLAEGDAERIAESHSLHRQKRRIESFDFDRKGVKHGQTVIYDPDTLLHHNHVRSGEPRQWEQELTVSQAGRIEEVTGDWLPRHGYDVVGAEHLAAPALSAGVRLRLRLWRWGVDLRQRFGVRSPVAPLRRLRRIGSAVVRAPTSVRGVRALGVLRITGRRGRGVRLTDARRILVVRLDRIGDVVLTLPMLRALRRSAPNAEVTLVVRPEAETLVAENPDVDRVLIFDPVVEGRVSELGRHGRALVFAARHFWGRRPDLALIPRFDVDLYHATALAYLSGAPRRMAYTERATDAKALKNAGFDRLVTDRLERGGVKHEAERNLDMIRALHGSVRGEDFRLALPAAARTYPESLLPAETGPVVAFGVGAAQAKRRWPVSRYIDLGRWLVREWGARLVVLGGPGEESLGQALAAALDDVVLDLVGRTTLPQAAALLERSDLFIGNDTGIMHLAAAAGTPVVELSCHPLAGMPEHYNSPVRFGPWRVPSRVLQPDAIPPCEGWCQGPGSHCIQGIDLRRVQEATTALLGASGEVREPAVSLRSGTEP